MKKIILMAITAILLLTSCHTTKEVIRYVEVPKISVKVDSIYTHSTDSFIQTLSIKGDTVFKTRFKTFYYEKIKLRTDTVTNVKIEKGDTIIKEIKVKDWIWWVGLITLFSALFTIIYFSIGFFRKIR